MSIKFHYFKVSSLFVFAITFLSSCCGSSYPCFCGCNGSKHLSILNEPITQKTLASVHVNSPDSRHELNAHGQRFSISWKLPKQYLGTELKGLLKIRFGVPEQIEVPFEISKLSGTWTYQVINEDYFSKEGILAYKALLFSDGEEVDHFQHKMWVELITFDP